MANYCNVCKVNIDEHISNCPLCGKCVSIKEKSIITTETTTYPNLHTNNTKKFPVHLISFILLLLTLCFFALEFFITDKIYISFYALATLILCYFAIIIPIKHNFSFATSGLIALIFLQGYLLFIELFSGTFGWGVNYVMPLISLSYSIYNGILIVAKGYFNFEYYLPVVVSAIISTVLLIVNYLYKWVYWPSLAAFLFAWLVALLIAFIKTKRLKKSIQKKSPFSIFVLLSHTKYFAPMLFAF